MPVLPGKIAVLYLLNAKATMKLPLYLPSFSPALSLLPSLSACVKKEGVFFFC